MILTNSEANKITRGVFLDIAGAFDAVPHYLLVKKLQAYGISGNSEVKIISENENDFNYENQQQKIV